MGGWVDLVLNKFIAMNRFKIAIGRESDFENWKKSEAFRKAHSGGGQHQGIYLGHPEFEGFEVIL